MVEEHTIYRTDRSWAKVTQRSLIRDDPLVGSRLYTAVMSVFIKKEEDRLRRYFLYVGEALLLEPDNPYVKKLIHKFYTSGDLTKHFKRKHLLNIQEGDKI